MNPQILTFTRRYDTPLDQLFVAAERGLGFTIPRPDGIDFEGAEPLWEWVVPARTGQVNGVVCSYSRCNPARIALKRFLADQDAFVPDLWDTLAFVAEHGRSLAGVTIFPADKPVRKRDRAHLYLVVDKAGRMPYHASFQVFGPEHVVDPPTIFGLSKAQPHGRIPWCEAIFRDFP